MATVQVVNPRRRKKRSASHRRRRRNPAPAVVAGSSIVANPRRRRRRNPYAVGAVMNPRRKRRNPGRGRTRRYASGLWGNLSSAFSQALPIVLGIYLSKYITRVVLKQRDAGAVGYAANAGVGLALAAGARAAGKRQMASGIAVGAMAGVILRALVDRIPPNILPSINGVGDYVGRNGMSGLGVPELDIDHRYGFVMDSSGSYAGYPGMYGVGNALGDYIARQ